MGLSVSDVVRVFLMRVAEKQLPFALKNKETRPTWPTPTLSLRRAARALRLHPNCSMNSKRAAASKRAGLLRDVGLCEVPYQGLTAGMGVGNATLAAIFSLLTS